MSSAPLKEYIPLRETARDRWPGILPELNIPPQFLNGKHQPCPVCGGSDRARWDNKDGYGTYYCNQCGAGDGISLVMKVNKWDFKTAARRIEVLANKTERLEPGTDKPNPAQQRLNMAKRWRAASPIESSETVRKYLEQRGINPSIARNIREYRGEMLALVRDVEGRGCQVHRTILGGEKRTRLFMPGHYPRGGAVRLMACQDHLGIAEGIETALSAAIIFRVPTWAALTANQLENWEPPVDISNVTIFGDNDMNFTGQAAAFKLARRLSVTRARLGVRVCIPTKPGTDWNDVLRNGSTADQASDSGEPDRAGSAGAG